PGLRRPQVSRRLLTAAVAATSAGLAPWTHIRHPLPALRVVEDTSPPLSPRAPARGRRPAAFVSTAGVNPAVRPTRQHAPGMIRTCDLCLRRAALYPLSYGRSGWSV